MLDFTKSEQQTVIFLLVCFGLGMVIKSYRYLHESVPVLQNTSLLSAKEAGNQNKIDNTSDKERVTQPARIPINRASLEELENVPGIGPVLGKRILDYRIQHGGFRSLDELKNVKGIGKKSYEKIAPFIVMN